MAENKNRELLQHELAHIHTYNIAYEDATDDFIRILKEVINLAVTAEKLMTAGEVIDLLLTLARKNIDTQYQAHQELVETYTKNLVPFNYTTSLQYGTLEPLNTPPGNT
jgi:hypothetical protein